MRLETKKRKGFLVLQLNGDDGLAFVLAVEVGEVIGI